MGPSTERSTRARRLRGLCGGIALISACASSPGRGATRIGTETEDAGLFLASGMRETVTVSLSASSCTRLSVPHVGTLRDVDLGVIDDAGQLLAADTRERGAPIVEVCTRDARTVHALVHVESGAGYVRLVIACGPRRDAARATRGEDVAEQAFVDFEEPTPFRTLRVHAEELARRGFTQTEPIGQEVIPETRQLELPVAVRPGTCATVSVCASALDVVLVDAHGASISVGSQDGDLVSVQTCDEGAQRVLIRGSAGAEVTFLVATGDAREVGGQSGLWLGHPATVTTPDDEASPARHRPR